MKYFTLLIISLFFSVAVQSQQNSWNYLNFESGGFVTEIIPVKYPSGSQPGDIGQQVLYSRTDIGGIYRSTNNGNSWVYASNYFNLSPNGNAGISPSEIQIQGLAIRHDAQYNKQVLLVAWGNDENDAKPNYKSIWRSDNSGETGSWVKANIPDPYVWFQGNNLPVKIGGPCIMYDPNNINGLTSIMYMGGFGPSDENGHPGRTYLFKSVDDGRNWSKVSAFEQQVAGIDGEGIICISIKEGNTDNIWIGTTHRIIFTTNGGANWQTRSISGVATPYIKRILLRKDGSSIIGAMVTWGMNSENTGICKFEVSNNWTYNDIKDEFFTGYTTQGEGFGMFSTLTYVDEAETIIIAGKYERPLRKTSNFGSNWYGEDNPGTGVDDQVVFRYSDNGNNFPAHQQRGELGEWGFMFDGLSCLTKNPNTNPNWTDHWYLSGGAGPRMTVIGTSNNNFSDSKWKYTAMGQSMTVNYDVAFNTVSQNGLNNGRNAIYLPLSDWTMGWTYSDRLHPSGSSWLIQDTLSYDRQETRPEYLDDTYISNVIRILFKPNTPNVSYCAGGSIYDFGSQNRLAGFFKRTISSTGTITFTPQNPGNDPMLSYPDRAIVDAIMIPLGENSIIVALVGQSTDATTPTIPYTGICCSIDEGLSWNLSSFDLPCQNPNISTQAKYSQSKISGLTGTINGTVGSLFDGHFSLCYAENGRVYLWLESSNNIEPYGGGLFVSLNNGANWEYVSVQPHDGYKGPGSLKYLGNNEIALAVRGFDSGFQHGLYKGTITTTNGGINWNQFGDFISAEHIEYQAPGTWAVFGKRTNDVYNQIYKSTNNGTTWSRIPENPETLPYFPKVNSLRIRPSPYNNELWIATSGQGVYIYKNFQKNCLPDITSHFVIQDQPFTYDCDNDIVVKSGGFLEIKNCSSFKMPSGKSIKVESGGKLICDHVNFDCSNSNEMFGGIEFINYTDGSGITDCVFNNASTGINLYNHFLTSYDTLGHGVPIADLNIENNTFNITGTNSIGIYGDNVYNLSLINNTFNNSGSNCQSAVFINTVRAPQGEDLSNYIFHNTFNEGSLQLSLTGFSSQLTYCSIHNNTFNSGAVCLLGRMITGKINKNHFQSDRVQNTVQLIQSDPNLLDNEIINTGEGFCMTNSASYPVMAPIPDGFGGFTWFGGMNDFNSYAANNIDVKSGYPIIDYGENKFTINKPESYHIYGTVEDSLGDTYYCRNNCWFGGEEGKPQIYIWNNNSNPLNLNSESNISCNEQLAYNGYFLSQITNNIYDTIFTSIDNTGSPVPPDEIYFSGGLKDKGTKLFTSAVGKFKTIINNYPSSKYLNGSMIELYSCYEKMDTLDNNNRIMLFTELKNYIAQKIQQYQSNLAFTDVAYNFLLMAKVNSGELSEAADGYLFLSLNHPEPERRLLASMDYECVLDIMGNGGGEKESAKELSSIEKNIDRLIIKDTLTKITSKNYDKEKNNIKLNTNANKLKIDAATEKKFDDKVKYNLVNAKNLTKEQKSKNRIENIMLIAGVKQTRTTEITNTVPTKYQLYQNYPNPFNPVTKIAFDLPRDANVKLIIYDILGREIKTLVNNEFKKAGKYLVEFNGSNLASGVYFYRIQSGDFISVKKMVMIK